MLIFTYNIKSLGGDMEFVCFINIFYRYGKKLLEKMLADKNISMQELIVILVIDKAGGIFQSRLIKFTGLDKSNLSKFLKSLEDRNLIYREECPDSQGQNTCYLTEQGQALVPYLKETLDDWKNLITKDIEEEKIKYFSEVSFDISKNIFKELED